MKSLKSTSVLAALDRQRKWVLSAPALIFVFLMIVIPLVWTLYLSFTNAYRSLTAGHDLIGLENYFAVLTDTKRFWPAVFRTLVFTGSGLAVQLVLGMLIALLLWRHFRGAGLVRVAILLPLVATPVAVAMMWMLIFEPNIGVANVMLEALGLPRSGWISDPLTAMPTLIFIDVWQWTPMVVLILLAGLMALPDEPDEAARVDGANVFQRFFYVTLPLMIPSIIGAVLLRGIDALKTFDILYASKGMGGGSLNEVETLNIYAYGLTFGYNDYGRASTVLVLFFLIIVGLCSLYLLKKKERS